MCNWIVRFLVVCIALTCWANVVQAGLVSDYDIDLGRGWRVFQINEEMGLSHDRHGLVFVNVDHIGSTVSFDRAVVIPDFVLASWVDGSTRQYVVVDRHLAGKLHQHENCWTVTDEAAALQIIGKSSIDSLDWVRIEHPIVTIFRIVCIAGGVFTIAILVLLIAVLVWMAVRSKHRVLDISPDARFDG